jgi:hypothetical protein
VTPFPKLLAGVANLATPLLSRLIGRSRDELIKMLQTNSAALEQLSLDFSERLYLIKIASFIEQLTTAPAATRVSMTRANVQHQY